MLSSQLIPVVLLNGLAVFALVVFYVARSGQP